MAALTADARIAVVLFNLGGPDRPEAVRPFLFNLFSDPLILRQPALVRRVLARLIAARRAPQARQIYARIGGRSPILELTRAQAAALERALGNASRLRVFVAMRYWHPFAAECAAEVKRFAPDGIVLLPLYPQFSTTTTASFLRVWRVAAAEAGLSVPTTTVCCWPSDSGFVGAMAASTRRAIEEATRSGPVRVLFSAHGLPERFVAAGDPYRSHVERTVAAIVAALDIAGLDHVICYQSRVGPLAWLKPYTEVEVRRAAEEGRAIVLVPMAFVSEHSETLVELDMEYAHLAQGAGAAAYIRVPTVGTDGAFIEGLAGLVRRALARGPGLLSGEIGRICETRFGACPFGTGQRQ